MRILCGEVRWRWWSARRGRLCALYCEREHPSLAQSQRTCPAAAASLELLVFPKYAIVAVLAKQHIRYKPSVWQTTWLKWTGTSLRAVLGCFHTLVHVVEYESCFFRTWVWSRKPIPGPSGNGGLGFALISHSHWIPLTRCAPHEGFFLLLHFSVFAFTSLLFLSPLNVLTLVANVYMFFLFTVCLFCSFVIFRQDKITEHTVYL